ncbi:MAG: RNA polymerase sporulation sigma factor SigE [Hydrogenibacillus schlegelii]|uniref:RNA polymerase sporulation sigma factor SigE n=1 Tax=Hydrogenibacillus schlegelii TaxID=1484 RepID=A0A947CXA1_HYDSH|nr:RNA polymerase sporulation sigma factor SigE [Hydrogenibacillus schlegelii]
MRFRLRSAVRRMLLSLRLAVFRLLIRLRLVRRRPVHYLSGPESLPPPLSPEEEAALIERLRSGDPAARSALVERNLRLVVYIARKFDQRGTVLEDLIGIGSIGLIKAVNTFDPEKKIKLATYASRCIENEILMFLRRNHKLRAEVSLDEPLNVDGDGNELLIADVLGTDDDEVERDIEATVERELLHAALEKLDARERTIMALRFGLEDGRELTQKEVADRLGISQSYISRLEKRIIKRLKREIDVHA